MRLAAGGETVLISDRDRVVAELVPPHPTRATPVSDAVLADAVRRGFLTPPLGDAGALPDTPGVAPLKEILAGLTADRTDR